MTVMMILMVFVFIKEAVQQTAESAHQTPEMLYVKYAKMAIH